MRRFFASDVLKIFVYVAGVLILGAALAPVLYNLGKGLAETTADKQTNHLIRWLADAARRSSFPRFFDRSLLISALILLFPLLSLLRLGKKPGEPSGSLSGQPLQRNPHGWAQSAAGMALAAGSLMLSGWLMVQAGAFIWRDAPMSAHGEPNAFIEKIAWAKALRKSLSVALVVSVMEEVLFRGVLLGIFLRAMRPGLAIASLSFLFAFVHFMEPPPGVSVPDPDSAGAGFALLGQIFARYADPLSLLSRFMVLAAVGLVLASARYRTASLWLPIGLHAGWILGSEIFKCAVWPAKNLPALTHWMVGDTMKEGLLPLSIVLFTGFLVQLLTPAREPEADEALP